MDADSLFQIGGLQPRDVLIVDADSDDSELASTNSELASMDATSSDYAFNTQHLDPRSIISWPTRRQEAYKRRLATMITEGSSLEEARDALNLTNFVIARWRREDERIDTLLTDWERSRAMTIEFKMDDVMDHPGKHMAALAKPMWFNFHIARLKALDARYKDNTQISVDARSITVGSEASAQLTANARSQQATIDQIKRDLRARQGGS